MVEVRKITKDEAIDASKIFTVAFNTRRDYSAKDDTEFFDASYAWTWGVYDDGRMVSMTSNTPWTMRFDRNDVIMGALGPVGSYPESRKGGNISRIFDKLLPEAYETGQTFTSLSPFSHSFYRKFGYELCCPRMELTIATSEFAKYKYSGSFQQIMPGDDTKGLEKVHTKYISDINHAIHRSVDIGDKSWKSFTKNDPYKTGIYTYLWKDSAGEPRAYIKYKQENMADGGANRIAANEIMFTDMEALYSILALVGALASPRRDFTWMMPMFLDPTDFIDVPWGVQQKVDPRHMTRVVNVKKAFELMRKPEGEEGEFIVEVEDPFIRENEGKWLVEYSPAGSRVTKTDKAADLKCGIPALSQLVTGYRTLDGMLRTSRLPMDVRGNEKTFRRVFTLRPQHMTEFL